MRIRVIFLLLVVLNVGVYSQEGAVKKGHANDFDIKRFTTAHVQEELPAWDFNLKLDVFNDTAKSLKYTQGVKSLKKKYPTMERTEDYNESLQERYLQSISSDLPGREAKAMVIFFAVANPKKRYIKSVGVDITGLTIDGKKKAFELDDIFDEDVDYAPIYKSALYWLTFSKPNLGRIYDIKSAVTILYSEKQAEFKSKPVDLVVKKSFEVNKHKFVITRIKIEAKKNVIECLYSCQRRCLI